MLFMCTTKFDMESEQLSLMEEYLTTQETQTAKEEKDAQKKQDEFDPISDDEDEPSATRATSQTIQPSSERALGKRRAEAISDEPSPLIELDEADEISLPDNSHFQEESSTQRRSSGRLPKRLRRDEDFVYE
jgi:hypothetical protein